MEANALEIADALTQVRDLQDEPGRAAFVQLIGEALGAPLFVPSATSPKIFLYNLVRACLDQVGGMDALLRAVDFLAGSTHAAALVRRHAGPARELLQPAAEVRIKEVLQGLTLPSLARIHHVAAGTAVAASPPRLEDAWQAFCILLDTNTGPDGVPPHLLFVELLIRALDREAASDAPRPHAAGSAARLRIWMAGELDALRAEGAEAVVEQLERIRSEKELQVVKNDLPIHLIIQLEPVDGRTPGRSEIRVSHWRQFHPFEWRPVRGTDRIVAREDVHDEVRALVQEAEGGWANQLDDSLVLEFVLPYGLLHLAPDEWTRDPPAEPYPTPLGTEYEVIVRSYERMYDLTMHRAWRQRWRVLLEAMECLVHWPEGDRPAEPHRFRNRLMSQRNVVACVLGSPPDREPGRTQLRMAIRTGVPVVLWDRGEIPIKELRDVLSEVIERPDMRSLPTDLKRLRRERSVAAESSAGVDSVSLIFDDPAHFLDEVQRFRPPE
ncbi:hypothetical protein [Spirillospora sp. NPDC029432]|uniref:VMAP-C domain-containing protein n=1 Tax=Spirillospora sp. NPDC029432 TaxID=3154599 RepID=UPI003455B5DD